MTAQVFFLNIFFEKEPHLNAVAFSKNFESIYKNR